MTSLESAGVAETSFFGQEGAAGAFSVGEGCAGCFGGLTGGGGVDCRLRCLEAWFCSSVHAGGREDLARLAVDAHVGQAAEVKASGFSVGVWWSAGAGVEKLRTIVAWGVGRAGPFEFGAEAGHDFSISSSRFSSLRMVVFMGYLLPASTG